MLFNAGNEQVLMANIRFVVFEINASLISKNDETMVFGSLKLTYNLLTVYNCLLE